MLKAINPTRFMVFSIERASMDINEYYLTVDSKNGHGPTLMAVGYATKEEALDWAKRFSTDSCHSGPGWEYGVVRIVGGFR